MIYKCAKCVFRLETINFNPTTGNTSHSRYEEGLTCPNGCGDLIPVIPSRRPVAYEDSPTGHSWPDGALT